MTAAQNVNSLSSVYRMLEISNRVALDQWQWEHATFYRFPWYLVLVLRGTQLPTPARLYTRGTCRDWGIVPTQC